MYTVSAFDGKETASQFTLTYRYIAAILSINNLSFENCLDEIYPFKLNINDTAEINTSTSLFYLLLLIGKHSQFPSALLFYFLLSSLTNLSISILILKTVHCWVAIFIFTRVCLLKDCGVVHLHRTPDMYICSWLTVNPAIVVVSMILCPWGKGSSVRHPSVRQSVNNLRFPLLLQNLLTRG